MSLLKKLNLEFFISLALLVFAIWFNLNLYRVEPTAKIDPNDNTFQFGLVDRTNTIWDFANRECSKNIITYVPCHLSYMTDHWVHNWAQGYNLPFYYAHWPQILIVASWRFINSIIPLFNYSVIPLFTYYHQVIYMLLCLFPLPVFLALRVIGLPWIIAGTGAVLATHISTDGLYGIDPPSFLWRGWGLSSQLFAMIWLPLAIAYTYKYFSSFSLGKFRSLTDLIVNHIAVISPLPIITNYLNEKGITKYTQLSASDESEKEVNTSDTYRYRQALYFWLAVFFMSATVAGHLGIGMMAMLSIPVFFIAEPLALAFSMNHIRVILKSLADNTMKLILLGGLIVLILGYFIIPVVIYGDFHNFSFWDPLWKFHSFGWNEVMVRFFNGELFDWGRAPWFTVLVIIGAFVAALHNGNQQQAVRNQENKAGSSINYQLSLPRRQAGTINYFPFSLLFAFWMLMYFGRTTWGGLIDIIPGMSEQHISRFIVGLHLSGLFLAPMAVYFVARQISWGIYRFFSTRKKITINDLPAPIFWTAALLLTVFVAKPIYKQTAYYNELNDRLIIQANTNYDKGVPEVTKMFEEIRKLPAGRVFVGRGGGWGKDFTLAETDMFMHISTFGVPTALWLPETWSPNSDTEQYFSEDVARDYDTYNLRWIFAPPSVKPQPFWTEKKRSEGWVLYEAPTTGYFTPARRTMNVVSDKYSYKNLVRLWIQSPIPEQKLYPELSFAKPVNPLDEGVPVIEMVNESDYKTMQGEKQNIFDINPLYAGDAPAVKLVGPEVVDTDMTFTTTVEVPEGCKECMVVLKQTYHPNWTASVDGQSVKPIITFPFHIGVPLADPGTHQITLSYKPHPAKVPLMAIAALFVASLLYPFYVPFLMKLTVIAKSGKKSKNPAPSPAKT